MIKEISVRAAKARVQRRLNATGEYLKHHRDGYLVIDQNNTITATTSDLEKLARDMGAMMGNERIKESK